MLARSLIFVDFICTWQYRAITKDAKQQQQQQQRQATKNNMQNMTPDLFQLILPSLPHKPVNVHINSNLQKTVNECDNGAFLCITFPYAHSTQHTHMYVMWFGHETAAHFIVGSIMCRMRYEMNSACLFQLVLMMLMIMMIIIIKYLPHFILHSRRTSSTLPTSPIHPFLAFDRSHFNSTPHSANETIKLNFHCVRFV